MFNIIHIYHVNQTSQLKHRQQIAKIDQEFSKILDTNNPHLVLIQQNMQ